MFHSSYWSYKNILKNMFKNAALGLRNNKLLSIIIIIYAHVEDAIVTHFDWKKKKRILLVDSCEDPHPPRLHFPFIFIFRAKAMWSIFSNQRMEPVYLFRAFAHLRMADVMVSKRASTPDSFVYSKGKHPFWGEKTLKITWPFMRLIEVKEKFRISDEQARIQSSESDAREEEVLAWKHDVSFNGLAIDYSQEFIVSPLACIRWTWHFAWSATWVRSARRGEEKNKAPLTGHFSNSPAHLCPQVLTYGGDVKTWSITQKLSPFWLPETPITA